MIKKNKLIKEIPFKDLESTDLYVDAMYKSGNEGGFQDEVIGKIFPVQNQGGFIISGSYVKDNLKYVILYSSMDKVDWPDNLDSRTGIFQYYGDNQELGSELHDTRKNGNNILRDTFGYLARNELKNIPPYFVFTKYGKGRDVLFRGLAVPGGESYTSQDELVAIWKTKDGLRFQNYLAIFTILDIPVISRAWLDDLQNGKLITKNTPRVYRDWLNNKVYKPLISEKIVEYRNKDQQIPTSKNGKELINIIYDYYPKGSDFEKCAIEIVKLMDKNVIGLDGTRPVKDGGRDGVGEYRIGTEEGGISINFAMEAKCYKPGENGVNVKDTSRLISRLKHREFGVIVTTSYVGDTAYKEIRKDRHPVIILSAIDIIKILENHELNTKKKLTSWLNSID